MSMQMYAVFHRAKRLLDEHIDALSTPVLRSLAAELRTMLARINKELDAREAQQTRIVGRIRQTHQRTVWQNWRNN